MVPYEWTAIDSSTIRAVKFAPNPYDANGTLIIEFTSGKMFKYEDVPSSKVETLIHHPSSGTYFHDQIRGEYETQQVTETGV